MFVQSVFLNGFQFINLSDRQCDIARLPMIAIAFANIMSFA